jgi:hypothetical protein
MIPYIIAIVAAVALSSPNTVVSWLPSVVNENERNAIRTGLENTSQGIQETGGAVVNVILRMWMNIPKEPDDK